MKKIIISILVFLFITVGFSFSFATMRGDSGTVDEIAHIPAGYTYLKYHDYRLNPEHPPLIKEIAALPLMFQSFNFDTSLRDYEELINGQWESGWDFIYRQGNDSEKILFWSRLPILLLYVIFALSFFIIVKKYYGRKVALFSLFLLCFSPTITGHNHYVTTDLGAAFFIFLSIYFFLNFLKNPKGKSVIWAGVFLGLAQLAKFSAVLLFPLFIILLFLKVFSPNMITGEAKVNFRAKASAYIIGFILSCLICYILVGVVYALTMYAMPDDKIHQLIVGLFGEGDWKRSVLLSIYTIPVLKYYAQYFLGLFMVFGRVAGGNTTFMLGYVTNQSFFWYFPVAFLTKEMLGFLIMFTISLITVFRKTIHYWLKIKKDKFKSRLKILIKNFWKFFEKNLLQFTMLLFIFIYMLVTLKGNLNIGIRHLLPVIPMIYILTARGIIEWSKHDWFKIGIISILGLWIIASYVLVYPKYLSYFNELAGGTNNGYKILTDSNLDWGQDLKRLAKWVDEKNIKKIKLDYFGGSVPEYYLGNKYERWTSRLGPTKGWIAVSATYLQNSRWYHLTLGEPDYNWLREKEPKAIIGGSILVYYIE